MTTEEVLQQLRFPGNTVPREAIAEVIARPEEFVPLLLREIEIATELADEADLSDSLASFALYLLAQLRETRALEPILRFFALDETTDEDLFGDMIGQDGSSILAAVGRANPERLREYALQPGLSPWVRTAVWGALIRQVLWGEQPREPLVEYFHDLFARNAFLDDPLLWTLLIGECLNFDPREFLEPIRGIYERDLVDIRMVGDFDDVEAEAEDDPETHHRDFVERHPPLTDTARAVRWWGNFAKPRPLRKRIDGTLPRLSDLDIPEEHYPPGEPVQRTEPKIGRNDLCPCGSGKKYKKCCLKKEEEGL